MVSGLSNWNLIWVGALSSGAGWLVNGAKSRCRDDRPTDHAECRGGIDLG